MTVTASACRMAADGRRRPMTCTSAAPRRDAAVARASTSMVVTLIPPAGDTLPPPMSIRKSVKKSVSSRMSP